MPRNDAKPPYGDLHLGDSQMARLVDEFDWASTPLGSPGKWPAELRTVVGQVLESRFPKAVVWGPELTTIYNDAFRPILGNKREALGRSFAEVWSEAWDEIGPIAERAFKGEATYIKDFPLVIERYGEPEQAWFTFCYSPLRLSDGTVAGMMDTVIETTDTVRARADLAVVNEELGHRLKNTLALVQSIATQTLKGVTEKDAVAAFTQRLVAMGRAHDVLLRQNWSAASLAQVAREILEPLDGLRQIAMSGAHVEIGSRATMALSLMLHELATNAAKYGALSVPEGRVTLSWAVKGATLSLEWRESGGPAVKEPASKGLGSRLLDRMLGGSTAVSMRFPGSGFEFALEVPVKELSSP